MRLKVNKKECGTRNVHIVGSMQVIKRFRTDYLL